MSLRDTEIHHFFKAVQNYWTHQITESTPLQEILDCININARQFMEFKTQMYRMNLMESYPILWLPYENISKLTDHGILNTVDFMKAYSSETEWKFRFDEYNYIILFDHLSEKDVMIIFPHKHNINIIQCFNKIKGLKAFL
jgi:hypothetical protein